METKIIFLRRDGDSIKVCAVILFRDKEISRTGEFSVSLGDFDYMIEHGCLL